MWTAYGNARRRCTGTWQSIEDSAGLRRIPEGGRRGGDRHGGDEDEDLDYLNKVQQAYIKDRASRHE